MQQLKYILKYLLSLINNPQQTWGFLADGEAEESKLDYMQANYYLPMMGVVAILMFLVTGWGSPFNLERAIKQAFIFLAAYFAGQYLAHVVLRKIYDRFFGFSLDSDRLQVFVSYSLSFLMFVELFSASFPSVKFIAFCALYLIYIVWSGTDVYFGIPEKNRWKFSAIAFFVIWGSPIVIGRIMAFMIR